MASNDVVTDQGCVTREERLGHAVLGFQGVELGLRHWACWSTVNPWAWR